MKKSEIIDILNDNSDDLFKKADDIRRTCVGDEVHLRGLIEFSSYCKCNCLYCGLRAQNTALERYRILKDEIITYARNAVALGYRTIVLQSGEDIYYSTDKMIEIIKEIKKLDVALTLSIGERTFEEYKEFKKAGCDRYLLRIETTDKNLYQKLHPKASFENRIECLYNLKSLGYETGTGVIAGLPEQTVESLAEDILFFKELNADMVGIGPFIPHPDTPLKNASSKQQLENSFNLALRVMSLVRLNLPDINIPATTAMETINPNGRIIALQSGANVVMPNVTGQKYRKQYEIYPDKICTGDAPEKCRFCIEGKIKSIGKTISKGYGFRGKN